MSVDTMMLRIAPDEYGRDPVVTARMGREQIARLEMEARRRRRQTGEKVHRSDLIREAVERFLASLTDP